MPSDHSQVPIWRMPIPTRARERSSCSRRRRVDVLAVGVAFPGESVVAQDYDPFDEALGTSARNSRIRSLSSGIDRG